MRAGRLRGAPAPIGPYHPRSCGCCVGERTLIDLVARYQAARARDRHSSRRGGPAGSDLQPGREALRNRRGLHARRRAARERAREGRRGHLPLARIPVRSQHGGRAARAGPHSRACLPCDRDRERADARTDLSPGRSLDFGARVPGLTALAGPDTGANLAPKRFPGPLPKVLRRWSGEGNLLRRPGLVARVRGNIVRRRQGGPWGGH